MKRLALTGQQFANLTVITLAGISKGSTVWNCSCVCGETVVVEGKQLKSGNTKSCGCLLVDKNKERATHGMRHTSEYTSWNQMVQRCTNPNSPVYHRYGGRGIKIYKPWLQFENFIVDMGKKPTSKHSINRIDNDSDYKPSNCEWADDTTQCNNRSSSRFIRYMGQSKTIAQWARETGIKQATISRRLGLGWSSDKALTEGVK